jgi:hypothetical protein
MAFSMDGYHWSCRFPRNACGRLAYDVAEIPAHVQDFRSTLLRVILATLKSNY